MVALTAGHRADSAALIGFGLDSIIEVSSAAAVAWQFSARDYARREAREHLTLRIIAVSFFALALYVSVESLRALLGSSEAQPSSVGIVLAGLACWSCRSCRGPAPGRTGAGVGHRGGRFQADAVVHLPVRGAAGGAGAQRSCGLVVGRPDRRLVIAVIAVKEGWQAWRGGGLLRPQRRLLGANSKSGSSTSGCGCGGNCCS